MQAPYRPPPTGRIPSHNGAKRQILGNPAKVAPAWKPNAQGMKDKGKVQAPEESKILLSRLPVDVGDTEVEELFKKTVGPVKEAFIIYNSQGRSKGMAVVTFQRPGDAAVARAKYDGKFVDQKRPIKIEIITDGVPAAGGPAASTGAPSLLSRLSGVTSSSTQPPTVSKNPAAPASQTRRPTAPVNPKQPRTRTKKGPRRVRKSVAQLDQEMEDYRMAADMFDTKPIIVS